MQSIFCTAVYLVKDNDIAPELTLPLSVSSYLVKGSWWASSQLIKLSWHRLPAVEVLSVVSHKYIRFPAFEGLSDEITNIADSLQLKDSQLRNKNREKETDQERQTCRNPTLDLGETVAYALYLVAAALGVL